MIRNPKGLRIGKEGNRHFIFNIFVTSQE